MLYGATWGGGYCLSLCSSYFFFLKIYVEFSRVYVSWSYYGIGGVEEFVGPYVIIFYVLMSICMVCLVSIWPHTHSNDSVCAYPDVCCIYLLAHPVNCCLLIIVIVFV